jgi:uncharacterized protein YoaH (UPF0181 family)
LVRFALSALQQQNISRMQQYMQALGTSSTVAIQCSAAAAWRASHSQHCSSRIGHGQRAAEYTRITHRLIAQHDAVHAASDDSASTGTAPNTIFQRATARLLPPHLAEGRVFRYSA